MKKIIFIFTALILITGCDSNSFLEKMGFKEKVVNVVQERDGVTYLPNEGKPFTGKYETYYKVDPIVQTIFKSN